VSVNLIADGHGGHNKTEDEMKRYQGKSANQILKASEIKTMKAGTVEVVYEDMIVNALGDDSQIHLRNAGGLVASVDLTPRAKVLFNSMIEKRDARG
jgi:hypothetical protein